jgi:hypothetical protein
VLLWNHDELATSQRQARLQRAWAAVALVLFAATWRLWTPQDLFPQVPLLAPIRNVPAWFDWLGAMGIVVGLVLSLAFGARRFLGRAGLWVFAGSAAAMFAFDQHRLQPWAYQFVLIAVVLSSRDGPRSSCLLRWLAIAIYFWSAVGKFDYTFLHGVGQQFLAVIANWFGLTIDAVPPQARLFLACVFPTGELIVAVALGFQPTRRFGFVGAVFLHVMLIAVLGPWGLNHQLGVLVWNVFFLIQAWFLFGPTIQTPLNSSNQQTASREVAPTRGWGTAESLIAMAIMLPALEPWGYWDHWMSWGLYSTRAERVEVQIHPLAVFRLPVELQAFVRERKSSDDWHVLEIDRWSLATLRAPVYPQARFQLGVAEAVGIQNDLGGLIQAIHWGPSNRWSGARTRTVHRGVGAIQQASDDSWLNGRPRIRRTTNHGDWRFRPK